MSTSTGQATIAQRYCTVAEAAEYIGSSSKFIRALIARGDLTGYRIGSRAIRVDLRALDSLLTPIPSAKAGGAQ